MPAGGSAGGILVGHKVLGGIQGWDSRFLTHRSVFGIVQPKVLYLTNILHGFMKITIPHCRL